MDMVRTINLWLFFMILIFFTFFDLIANDTTTRNNIITLSFSNISLEDKAHQYQDNLISIQLEVNRNITGYLGIGGYTGFGLYEEFVFKEEGGGSSLTYLDVAKSVTYGLDGNLHILPLLFQRDIPRFDLYISGELGLISLFSSDFNGIVPERGHNFNYSLMGGVSFYITKKFGLFTEAGYRGFKYHKGFNTKYGLTFKFLR
jgi:hypothetical protein